MESEALSAASAAAGADEILSGASQALAPEGFALALSKAYWFIMVPGVYLAFLAFFIFSALAIARILRAPARPYQLAIYPSGRRPLLGALRDAFGMGAILRRKPFFWLCLICYHLGFALLVLGHLDILVGLNFVPPESRHMLGAGAVGLMVTIPTFYFLVRRFASPVREISTPGDYLLLLLLLFTFLLGDLMSWGNSWTANGFVMSKADFALYFESLARFRFEDPRLYLHGSHYHFAVLHVFLAELLLVTLPFTKVVHAFFAVPLSFIRRRTWIRN